MGRLHLKSHSDAMLFRSCLPAARPFGVSMPCCRVSQILVFETTKIVRIILHGIILITLVRMVDLGLRGGCMG